MIEHRMALRRASCPDQEAAVDAERLLAPGAWTRLLARSRRAALDRAIAHGADPTCSALLAVRAAQLTRACTRREVAAGLERVAALAEGDHPRFRVVPRRTVARQNRETLIELADMLRGGAPAYARGIALLELVVSDGAGPAYADRDGTILARRLRWARECLAG